MTPYRLSIVTSPASEPVSLDEAKLHLRVDFTNDDLLIAGWIASARLLCESYLSQAFVETTYEVSYDCFPISGNYLTRASTVNTLGLPPSFYVREAGAIHLPRSPLIAVDSITYRDRSGATQILSSDSYRAISGVPGCIVPAANAFWPVTSAAPDAVTITFRAGYDTIPPTIKSAMLLLIGHWFENRSAVLTGSIATTLPWTVQRLLDAVGS